MIFREASKFADVLLHFEDIGLLSEVNVFNMSGNPFITIAKFRVNWEHKLFDSLVKKKKSGWQMCVLSESNVPTRSYSLGEIESGDYIDYNVICGEDTQNKKFDIEYKEHLHKIIKEHILKYNYIYASGFELSDSDNGNLGIGFDVYVKVRYVNSEMMGGNFNILKQILENNSKYDIRYSYDTTDDCSINGYVSDGKFELENDRVIHFGVTIIIHSGTCEYLGNKSKTLSQIAVDFNGYYYSISLLHDHGSGPLNGFRYNSYVDISEDIHDKISKSLYFLKKHIEITQG